MQLVTTRYVKFFRFNFYFQSSEELKWRWCFYQIRGGVYWNSTQNNIPWIYPDSSPVPLKITEENPVTLRLVSPVSSYWDTID